MSPALVGTPRLAVRRVAASGRPSPARGPAGQAAGATCFELVLVEAVHGGQEAGAHRAHRACGDALADGDLILVAPGRRTGEIRGIECTTHWVVTFHADALGATRSDGSTYLLAPDELFLAAFVREGFSERHFSVEPADRPHWLSRLRRLEQELCARELGSGEAAHALLELLLIDAARLARPHAGALSPPTRPLLAAVFRFIEKRFQTPIGLADVAKAVARSPSYLTDLVRRETGRTVLQWVIERRMAEARRLLLDTDVRVKDIGPRIGYDDAGHFSRQFHRQHGSPPQHWRLASRARLSDSPAREYAHPAETSPIVSAGLLCPLSSAGGR